MNIEDLKSMIILCLTWGFRRGLWSHSYLLEFSSRTICADMGLFSWSERRLFPISVQGPHARKTALHMVCGNVHSGAKSLLLPRSGPGVGAQRTCCTKPGPYRVTPGLTLPPCMPASSPAALLTSGATGTTVQTCHTFWPPPDPRPLPSEPF